MPTFTDAEVAEIAKRTKATQAAEAKKAEDAAAERKRAEKARFEARIEREFFSANPSATPEDFERLKPRLIDEALMAGKGKPEPTISRRRF